MQLSSTRCNKMVYFTTVTLLLVAVSALSVTANLQPNDDDVCSNPQELIEPCLKSGEFVRKYRRKMITKSRKARRVHGYDVCSESLEFRHCIQKKVHECPTVMDYIPVKWEKIYDLLDCACNGTQECRDELSCMEEEYNSHFLAYCDEQYRFNIGQNTHGKCHFLKHSLQCKRNLMKSACGHKAADFSKQMDIHLSNKKCIFMDKYSYPDPFEYTTQCPRNLTDMVDECLLNHIQYDDGENMVQFYKTNNLVAKSKKKKIKQSCRDYKEFKACIRPIKEQCHEGVHRIFEYNAQLRVYTLKMDYICTEAKDDYIENIQCFQDIIKHDKLDTCEHIWGDLGKSLKNVTAHMFYCDEIHTNCQNLKRELTRIISCYAGIFENQCNTNASKAMRTLLETAFQDPFYLRFDYKPDCNLHSTTVAPPTVNMPTTPRTSRGKKKDKYTKPVNREHENNVAKFMSSSSFSITTRTNNFVLCLVLLDWILLRVR